jgi:hypothetical protein
MWTQYEYRSLGYLMKIGVRSEVMYFIKGSQCVLLWVPMFCPYIRGIRRQASDRMQKKEMSIPPTATTAMQHSSL